MSKTAFWTPNLIRLRVRPRFHYISRDRIVLATDDNGFLHGHGEFGLFVQEARFLSRYRYLVNGRPPQPVSLSNVSQSSWMGYYLTGDATKGTPLNDAAQQAVEVRLFRRIDEGLREDVAITNYAQKPRKIRLTLQLASDFADIAETHGKRKQTGRVTTSWRTRRNGAELVIGYRASHRYAHQGDNGRAHLSYSLHIRLSTKQARPTWKKGEIHFGISLKPHEIWRCHIHARPILKASANVQTRTGKSGRKGNARNQPQESTQFESQESKTLASVVIGALKQGQRDLAALELVDLDQPDGGWVPAAGLPLYVALFGRDTLTAAWEAAPMTTKIMRGTLPAIAAWHGDTVDDWRDEQPGRMLHEMHTGPLSVLNYIPEGRDYGSVTTSAFYPFVVAQLWHWTGNKSLVAKYLDPAARALKWLDTQRSKDPGGFSWYRTHSTQGVKNQAWKDSGDAVVYADGSQVKDPIATCEQQGLLYAAKMNFAEVLWWFDRKDEASSHYRDAVELKKRFNDAFWMEKEKFIALALDPSGRQVRSIASNALHCITTGIVDKRRVLPVLKRLFAPDMFSGWGVRTLSARHPAYNPYAYHRGTVWPVEHGPFAVGAYRYGQHDFVERICRSQFELASLFDHARLPECVAGHPRDDNHPFPALYPAANSPQAWSATTPFTLVQCMLGMQPFAPLKLLFVDPFLPAWLPEITLSNMRVGNATVSIRFYRTKSGRSDYKVLDKRGTLRILRQPSPWSFTATLGERAKDAFASIFH